MPPRPSTLPRNENARTPSVSAGPTSDTARKKPVATSATPTTVAVTSPRIESSQRRSSTLSSARTRTWNVPSCRAWVMPSIRRGRRRSCSATIAD